jgi:acyl carrier protein
MFKCTLDQAQQMEATTLRNFVACVENALFGQDSSEATDERTTPMKPERGSSNLKPRDMTEAIRKLVATVTGLGPNEMPLDAEITDFGIDSLMGMELGREVERVFACTLDQTEQLNANTLRNFVACVENAVFRAKEGTTREDEDKEQSGDDEDFSGNSSAVVLVYDWRKRFLVYEIETPQGSSREKEKCAPLYTDS